MIFGYLSTVYVRVYLTPWRLYEKYKSGLFYTRISYVNEFYLHIIFQSLLVQPSVEQIGQFVIIQILHQEMGIATDTDFG